MRIFVAVLAVSIASLATAQTKLSVEIAGKNVGTASISQKLGADGSKTVDLKMDLLVSSQKMAIRSQNTYDKLGNPVRKFMDSNIPGGALQKQVIATFDAKGANIISIDGGKRSTRQASLVETAPRTNLSEFWFVRDQPKSGQKVRAYVLNMDSLSWELQTTIYRGKKSIKIGGKSVVVHEIETQGDRPIKAFLDDKGLPWLIETGGTTMRRIED
ncbi:MAG: hypothetical protein H7Y17_14555 [Chlorobia bacterium]|nr:hypothetical protein [Fimbriimonadaceae bacterium]